MGESAKVKQMILSRSEKTCTIVGTNARWRCFRYHRHGAFELVAAQLELGHRTATTCARDKGVHKLADRLAVCEVREKNVGE